jgi:uncharacterized protein (TIGR01777 family)
MRALITGATGLTGRALAPHFTSVVVLTRNPEGARAALAGAEIHAWKPMEEIAPPAAFEGVDVVVNLAGASVGEGRWSSARKHLLWESRVTTTRNLVRGMEQAGQRPQVFVSSSAIGYYGTRADEPLDETATSGADFLAKLCVEWEREALVAREFGVRVVTSRTALVLAREAPAFRRLLTVFRLGLGARLGNGRQWMSWVHLEDLIQLILHAVGRPEIEGPLNASAPGAVRNWEFTQTFAATLGRPAFLWAPKLGLRVLVGEFADALLASQRVIPQVAQQSGFRFRYPDLASALAAVVGSRS